MFTYSLQNVTAKIILGGKYIYRIHICGCSAGSAMRLFGKGEGAFVKTEMPLLME